MPADSAESDHREIEGSSRLRIDVGSTSCITPIPEAGGKPSAKLSRLIAALKGQARRSTWAHAAVVAALASRSDRRLLAAGASRAARTKTVGRESLIVNAGRLPSSMIAQALKSLEPEQATVRG